MRGSRTAGLGTAVDAQSGFPRADRDPALELSSHPWVGRGQSVRLRTDKATAVVLVGAPGAGKTSLLHRMVWSALRSGGPADPRGDRWDHVSVIDCKGGSSGGTQHWIDLAVAGGLDQSEIAVWPHRPWKLFEGGSGELDAAVAGAMLSDDGATIYSEITNALLHGLATSRYGSFTDVDDLLRRAINPTPWLDHDFDRQFANARTGSVTNQQTLVTNLGAALRILRDAVSPAGFNWRTPERFKLLSLDVGASKAALKIGVAALAALDADRFTSKRGRHLLILDEAADLYHASVAPPITRLAETLRSAGVSLVVAGQSYASFGDQVDGLLASSDLILGRTPNPDPFMKVMPTVIRPEHSRSVQGGTETGVSMYRNQHQVAHSPNDIRRFEPGEWLIVSQGRVVRMYAHDSPITPSTPT